MNDFFTRQQLIRRGWSRSLVAEIEPDEIVETKYGHPAYLFSTVRIEILESKPQFARRIATAWRCRRNYAESKLAHYVAILRHK